jgi:hypothetical protein
MSNKQRKKKMVRFQEASLINYNNRIKENKVEHAKEEVEALGDFLSGFGGSTVTDIRMLRHEDAPVDVLEPYVIFNVKDPKEIKISKETNIEEFVRMSQESKEKDHIFNNEPYCYHIEPRACAPGAMLELYRSSSFRRYGMLIAEAKTTDYVLVRGWGGVKSHLVIPAIVITAADVVDITRTNRITEREEDMVLRAKAFKELALLKNLKFTIVVWMKYPFLFIVDANSTVGPSIRGLYNRSKSNLYIKRATNVANKLTNTDKVRSIAEHVKDAFEHVNDTYDKAFAFEDVREQGNFRSGRVVIGINDFPEELQAKARSVTVERFQRFNLYRNLTDERSNFNDERQRVPNKKSTKYDTWCKRHMLTFVGFKGF